MAKKKEAVAAPPIRLDLGCGKNKAPGFTGVDARKFEGVDVVADLTKRWPWKDGSVDEVNCSHFVEHLDASERVHFVNELWRVLKPGGKAQVVTPHWTSARAYGDLTHKWPPVCEWWFFYLKKDWREVNAPHSDYAPEVDFEVTYGYTLHPALAVKSEEFRTFALSWYKEAAQDTVATFTKPVPKR